MGTIMRYFSIYRFNLSVEEIEPEIKTFWSNLAANTRHSCYHKLFINPVGFRRIHFLSRTDFKFTNPFSRSLPTIFWQSPYWLHCQGPHHWYLQIGPPPGHLCQASSDSGTHWSAGNLRLDEISQAGRSRLHHRGRAFVHAVPGS